MIGHEDLFGFGGILNGWTIISSNQTGLTSAPQTCNFPAGYQNGDAVIAIYFGRRSASSCVLPTLPSGWGRAGSRTNSGLTATNVAIGVDYLTSIAGQTSYVVSSGTTVGSGCHLVLIVLRPTNVPVSQMVVPIIKDYGDDAPLLNGDPSPPLITTNTKYNLVFAVGVQSAAISLNGSSGFTTLQSNSSTSGWLVQYAKQSTAGNIDPSDMSGSTSAPSIGVTFALRGSLTSPDTIIFTNFTTQISDTQGTVVATTGQTYLREPDGSFSLTVSGGNISQYRINGGAWGNSSGTVTSGDLVEVRQTSLNTPTGTTNSATATYTIDGTAYTYLLTTRRILQPAAADGEITWVVPTGVTVVNAIAIGAGGAGGTRFANATFTRGAGGGGGGALSYNYALSVTPGTTLFIRTGDGSSTNGVAGTDSYIRSSSANLVMAKGGGGGTSANSTVNGVGGAGGAAASGVGTVRQSGGRGGNSTSSSTNTHLVSGGGGGAGGYSGAGGAGANGAASATPNNGAAGAGGAAGGGGSTSGGGGVGADGAGTAGGTSSTGGIGGSGGSTGASGTASSGGTSGSFGGGSGAPGGTATNGTMKVTW